MNAEREMTLDEFVDTLGPRHRARRELTALRAENERLRGLLSWCAGRLLDAGDVEGHERVMEGIAGRGEVMSYEPFDRETASRTDCIAWTLCQILDDDAPMRWRRYRFAAGCIARNDELMADLLNLRHEQRPALEGRGK